MLEHKLRQDVKIEFAQTSAKLRAVQLGPFDILVCLCITDFRWVINNDPISPTRIWQLTISESNVRIGHLLIVEGPVEVQAPTKEKH